jgi:hypothetical protein
MYIGPEIMAGDFTSFSITTRGRPAADVNALARRIAKMDGLHRTQ